MANEHDSTDRYFKANCPACDGSIEFPAHGLGERIDCPHCNRNIELKRKALVRRLGSGVRGWFQQRGFNWKWACALAGCVVVCAFLYSEHQASLAAQKEQQRLLSAQLEEIKRANLAAQVAELERQDEAEKAESVAKKNALWGKYEQLKAKDEQERAKLLEDSRHNSEAILKSWEEDRRFEKLANRIAADAAQQRLLDSTFPPPSSKRLSVTDNDCPIDNTMMVFTGNSKSVMGKLLYEYKCANQHTTWIVL